MFFFFFNDTATTEIYTLSLHDALPISSSARCSGMRDATGSASSVPAPRVTGPRRCRSSRDRKSTRLNSSHAQYLVCRLLLEKKKKTIPLTTDDDSLLLSHYRPHPPHAP